MNKKAIILLSGGLDSTTVLALAKSQGFSCYALSLDYGQKHQAELQAARRVAQQYDVVEHHIMPLAISDFGGSALTDPNQAIPDHSGDDAIPSTYVPARNTIFLSIALGLAEIKEAHDIFIGVSSIDYSGYPDCRPDFIRAYQQMANLATKVGVEGRGVRIQTPLIYLSKAETIQKGLALDIDYSQTVSCYRADNEGRACGACDSCVLRADGFKQAGITDPTRYFADTVEK